MEKLNFSTNINAAPERVWQILWDDATYRQWTSVFHEGSHAKSDWQEGSKILFLGPSGDGMVSRIKQLVPNEVMVFEHLGEMRDGKEDLTQGWEDALESYFLQAQTDGSTQLNVELNTTPEFTQEFSKTFPVALAKVKELAEA